MSVRSKAGSDCFAKGWKIQIMKFRKRFWCGIKFPTMFKKFLWLVLAINLGSLFLGPKFVLARAELIKGPAASAVYYLDDENIRHVFSTRTVFDSWYGGDFSEVATVSKEFLASLPLGKNITVRPGTSLVKIQTSPKVYAIEPGGVLRQITDEAIAENRRPLPELRELYPFIGTTLVAGED